MATAKIIKANGVIASLEIKGRFGKSFILEGDELAQLTEYLKDESNLSKESTRLENSNGGKITINNKELRSLADKLKATDSLPEALEQPIEAAKIASNEILSPLPLKPAARTKQPVVPKPEPAQVSKLQVISIQTAPIEWLAYATCPNCKIRHSLAIKQSDGANQSQFAAQCECGQILFLQK
jgi:hypothetical protein